MKKPVEENDWGLVLSGPLLKTYNRAPVSFVSGKGAWLETSEGDRYLDLASGIAVNSLGHANANLIKALEKQAHLVWHTSNLYSIPTQEELASLLVKKTFADKVFFTNSGTESIECAIKMARKFYFDNGKISKTKIVTFEGSFHGRSMAAISASGTNKLTKGFGPLLPGFVVLPRNNFEAVKALDFTEVCAVLIEPIQGEGGINVSSKEFLLHLRNICDANDILLIFDEIQSGIGRSGKFFSYQFSGVSPDIVAVAKGIGGGFPLGCCLATSQAASGMTVGTHGSTFGGNPLACAVGLAVLNEIFSVGFLESVQEKGRKLRAHLEDLVQYDPITFDSVRGLGLMLGLKCKVENSKVIEAAYNNKLLLVPAADNVVRVLPPLNITDQDICIASECFFTLADSVRASL